ncbi:hypothetical protein [Aliivibrio fischeri]|uniref:hypothetical protein n=1 Tax=Aliivibrio fischeri TaxID=668 RepID=UPI0007C44F51|nr:hypothetical protein [Aliivibrio fischeri]
MNKVTTPIKHNLPLYSMRCNLGSQSKPFYSYVELGNFSSYFEAEKEMLERLKKCSALLRWEMFKDERLSNIQSTTFQEDTIYSHMTALPKTGFKLIININGNTDTDLILAFDEVKKKIEGGFTFGIDGNSSGNYLFDKYGEEQDDAEDE